MDSPGFRGGRSKRWAVSLGLLLGLAWLGSCASAPPPVHPVEFSAELQPTAGAQRQTGAFTPAAARSRHCHVRDPRMSLGFDGRWEMEFTARCEKRKRYGDCVCQARIAAHRPGGVVFETAARRFDVPNGPDWVRYDFGGDRGELRLAYTAVDRVSLQVLDAER